jgi:hypothetical protein
MFETYQKLLRSNAILPVNFIHGRVDALNDPFKLSESRSFLTPQLSKL